jgi:membrane-bound lytic murein transglycosylase D
MRYFLYAIGPCFLVPIICFAMLHYPALDREVQARLPLLSAYYISRQLAAEISHADSRAGEVPINYGQILEAYDKVPTNKDFRALENLSASGRTPGLAESVFARFILWKDNLPHDFLAADPVRDIAIRLGNMRRRQNSAEAVRDEIISKHTLDCLRYLPPTTASATLSGKGLPSETAKSGLVFCGETVPVERTDVRRRIEYQIAYLLTDFRDSTGIWLKRRDRYGEAIKRILEREGVPWEFALLPALESGYSRTVVSPSMAHGWWQFVRPTAVRSSAKEPELDWALQVDGWKDERRDLAISTRSAARYLKWLRTRLGASENHSSWLTAAAAYNAGFSETKFRIAAYQTPWYWDMKLPLETENYVPRWIAFSIIDANRKFYGLGVPPIAPIHFDTIEGIQLSRDLPLTFLATVTQSSVRFIREINGGLAQNETAFRAVRNKRDFSHTIHVPKGWKDRVLKVLKTQQYVKNTG